MALAAPDPIATALCRSLPDPLLALCATLETAGVATYLQGEGLLDAWLGSPAWDGTGIPALLCLAPSARIAALLPNAVVTAADGRRLSQASPIGPIDLLPAGDSTVERALAGFGLAPLAIALRPQSSAFADPFAQRPRLEKRELAALGGDAQRFRSAPRRLFLAAGLIARYGFEPTRELVESAREAACDAPPADGAPMRRALERVLVADAPQRALAFLRETGVTERLLPELDPANETRLALLDRGSALRWAAYLQGPGAGRALARLRMPHALARRITRLLEFHPLDRTIEADRDASIRRLLARLSPAELAGLILWRRSELASARPSAETTRGRERLDRIERAIERSRQQAASAESLRGLALSGADVMRILGAGPGPHVGRALAHLVRFVASDPARNDAIALEGELRVWRETSGGGPVR